MESNNNKDTDEAVLDVLKDDALDNLIRLSSGVVLVGKAAPTLTLIKVIARFPRPEPPEYLNKQTGRMMVNADDPDYIKRVQAQEAAQTDAVLNVLILGGTEVHSVPKKFQRHTDDGWLQEYANFNMRIDPEDERARYLHWVTYKAAPKGEDIKLIQEVVGRLSGISERAVQAAEDFPGRGKTTR